MNDAAPGSRIRSIQNARHGLGADVGRLRCAGRGSAYYEWAVPR
jgi:hypothetical protein